MSDWFGTYSLSESINASVDLEMPGIQPWRTKSQVTRGLISRKITLSTLKERAGQVLGLVQKLCRTNAEVSSTDFGRKAN